MYGDAVPDQTADVFGQKRHYLEDMVYSYDQVMTDSVAVLNLFASVNLQAPLKIQDAQMRFYYSLWALIKGERDEMFPESLPPPERMYFFTEEEFSAWRDSFLRGDDSYDELARFWLANQQSGYRKRMSVYMFYDVD